jgi:hypothetical protein
VKSAHRPAALPKRDVESDRGCLRCTRGELTTTPRYSVCLIDKNTVKAKAEIQPSRDYLDIPVQSVHKLDVVRRSCRRTREEPVLQLVKQIGRPEDRS